MPAGQNKRDQNAATAAPPPPPRADYSDEVSEAQRRKIADAVKHLGLDRWKQVGDSGW